MALPRGLQFVIVVFPDHTHLLFTTLYIDSVQVCFAKLTCGLIFCSFLLMVGCCSVCNLFRCTLYTTSHNHQHMLVPTER